MSLSVNFWQRFFSLLVSKARGHCPQLPTVDRALTLGTLHVHHRSLRRVTLLIGSAEDVTKNKFLETCKTLDNMSRMNAILSFHPPPPKDTHSVV